MKVKERSDGFYVIMGIILILVLGVRLIGSHSIGYVLDHAARILLPGVYQ